MFKAALIALISLASGFEDTVPQATITDKVFFDIDIDGEPMGRIVFGLFGDTVPKTVANFKALSACDHGKTKEGKALCYKGTIFHRVIKGFMAQGGDFERGDGRGGQSIYGGKFDDENFDLKMNGPFVLAMANAGPNTNGSQFFICFTATPWLNGNHAVFGHLVEGDAVLDALESAGSNSGKPAGNFVISDCGEIVEEAKA